MLKKLFPYLKSFPFVKSKLNISIVNFPVLEKLNPIAEKLFGITKPEYSIFLGTPSVHQKTTIQIFKGNKIFGYAKLSENREVAQLFNHEFNLLSKLHKSGIRNIPRPLFYGEIEEGKYLFIQDTKKTRGVKSPNQWTSLHENFLRELKDKTVSDIPFEETDFFNSLNYLKENIGRLPGENGEVLIPILKRIINELEGKTIPVSAYHADFTPWNMFVVKGQLYVFDWEYASLSYPSDLDKYHFYIQQLIHVEHLDAAGIIHRLKGFEWFDSALCQIYLTDIISRYLKREDKNLSDSFLETLKIWIKLLQRIEEE